MTTVVFPPSWSSLKHPHVRLNLLLELAELADPVQTARWLTSDPKGPVRGFHETVHFFFDDHVFNPEEIGWSLFDESEVESVTALVEDLDVILNAKKDCDDRFALSHPNWSLVESAARRALDRLQRYGIPFWDEANA